MLMLIVSKTLTEIQPTVIINNSRQGREKFLLFADDVNGTVARKSLNELKAAMTEMHLKLQKFCSDNLLKLNSGKTHFLVIVSSQRRAHHDTDFSLKLGDVEVEGSCEERVLGIQVGRDLCSWKYQIDHISRSIVQKCVKKMAGL